jgi:hypothetical protein
MPNWTNMTNRAAGYVYTSTNWNAEVVDNLTVLNDIIGHPNGGHVSLTDGGILLGNATGAIEAMAVLAKGSLVVGDAVTNPGVLTVGSNNTYLVADSAEALGVKWGSPAALSNPEDIMKFS